LVVVGGHASYLLCTLFLFPLVRIVREVVSVVDGATPAVTVLLRVVRVGDHLVALCGLLLPQQLLEADETGQDERQLADDEGLEGEQRQGSQGQGDERGGLQLQQEKKGKQDLGRLLLLASRCDKEDKRQIYNMMKSYIKLLKLKSPIERVKWFDEQEAIMSGDKKKETATITQMKYNLRTYLSIGNTQKNWQRKCS
jgi:hypothetical protein